MDKMVDKSGPRVQKMFGEVAPRYDFLNHLLSFGVDYYWRWQTVRRVPPTGECQILDLCTGTGDLALAYHRASQGRAQIVGADFCHEMLVRGVEKSDQAGAEIAFLEADAQHIPLETDRFDIVCVAFGLRNVADTARGLAEMARVCAPGGKVAVLEFSTPCWQPFKWFYSWYFRHILPRIGRLFSRSAGDAYQYLPSSVSQFPQGEQLVQLMRNAGLEDLSYHSLTFGIATLYVGAKRS